MKLTRQNLLTIVLIILALVLMVQTIQLSSINTAIKSGSFKASGSSSSDAGNGQTQLPTNLQNLPGMVGGC